MPSRPYCVPSYRVVSVSKPSFERRIQISRSCAAPKRQPDALERILLQRLHSRPAAIVITTLGANLSLPLRPSGEPRGRQGRSLLPPEKPRPPHSAPGAPPRRLRPSFARVRSVPPFAEWSARRGRKSRPAWAGSNQAELGRRGPDRRSAQDDCFMIADDHFRLTPFGSLMILKH